MGVTPLATEVKSKAWKTFDKKVSEKLTGGEIATKSLPLWELEQYKAVDLMQKAPMKWCPYKAYLTVDANVVVVNKNNRNYLVIGANLVNLLTGDANYNKSFGKAFQTTGTKRNQVKQIYRYCKATKYTSHVKTAREVFTKRQGDCSGIAAAFYVLCKAKGIPVKFVIGWTATGCHAWNKVKVGTKWYWIDACYGLWLCEEQFTGRKVMEIW